MPSVSDFSPDVPFHADRSLFTELRMVIELLRKKGLVFRENTGEDERMDSRPFRCPASCDILYRLE